MTSLGRVGRILAGTIDVTSSNTDKDTHSSNATTIDSISAAGGISNTTSVANLELNDTIKSNERKSRSTNSSNSNTSNNSKENSTSNAIMLQGK